MSKTPVIGSVVWYYPHGMEPDPQPNDQPLCAFITRVTADSTAKPTKDADGETVKPSKETRVNLHVLGGSGGTAYGRADVLLLQDEKTSPDDRYAQWPEDAPARAKADEAHRKHLADAEAARVKAEEVKAKKLADA